MKTAWIALVGVIIFTGTVLGQLGAPDDILSVELLPSQKKIVRGEPIDVALKLDINSGLHINSHQPTSDFYIPTDVSFEPMEGFSFGEPRFPEGEMKMFSFTEEKISVYENTVYIFVTISTAPFISTEPKTINGSVSYQGCNDTMCFPPEEESFELTLDVAESGTAVESVNKDIFAKDEAAAGARQYDTEGLTEDEQKALVYLERGLFSAILAFFVVGLALNLTPCVYPVIPLTVGYFGGQSDKTRGKAFTNALFYLVGIALAFALLGLISGLAGQQWGFLFQSPWFVVVIAAIILLMASSLFGAFEITVPSWLLTKVGQNRQGVMGSFLMGLTVGVVIAPCAAGIIIGLVGLIAKLGLVVKGTLLFFVMGLGLGLPYLVLATFSGLLNKLPQSGMWMIWVRKLFGFLLIGVALYFIAPQLERVNDQLPFLLGVTAIAGGLLLGFLEHNKGYTKGFKIFRAVIGIILIVLGINWVHSGIHAKESEIDWVHYNGQQVEELLQEGNPVFIDFYADWCAPCKQMDRTTFTDAEVTEMAGSFTMLKVDCTQPDATVKSFMNRFNVTGMPTLVFINENGKELKNLREVGYVPPDKFVEKMQETLESE